MVTHLLLVSYDEIGLQGLYDNTRAHLRKTKKCVSFPPSPDGFSVVIAGGRG